MWNEKKSRQFKEFRVSEQSIGGRWGNLRKLSNYRLRFIWDLER